MCSFDVCSLLTKVPLKEIINICVEVLYDNHDCQPHFPKEVFVELMYSATSSVEFSFDFIIYKKKNQNRPAIQSGPNVGLQLLNFFVCFKLTCGTLNVCGSVNKGNYLEMLCEVVVPQLHSKPNFYELFFQQDEAPPHYALKVRDYLNEVFPQRWFGRRGSIEWPPRSPDLTPMGFFFEGIVKNKVYEKNPKTLNELKDYIHDASKDFDEDRDLCRTVCQSVLDSCEECYNVGGGHFEHLKRLNSFCERYNQHS